MWGAILVIGAHFGGYEISRVFLLAEVETVRASTILAKFQVNQHVISAIGRVQFRGPSEHRTS